MTRFSHTASRRPLRIVALFLIYIFGISLFILPDRRIARASLHKGNKTLGENGILSPFPSPSPRPEPSATPRVSPSPTPDPSPDPTPEPTPTMTPTTAPSPTHGVPGTNLLNLDNLRNIQPVEPEVPEAVPSTRCSPGQPDCNPTTGHPLPPEQAFRPRRSVPRRKYFRVREDNMLAWNGNQFSTRFLKYGNSREATDTSVRTDAFFSLFALQTGGSYDDFVMARLDPDNRIGTGGEDMLSRNFNWSLPLVGIAGRAGLNLGLSLSYNSLVWTRSGNYITYDADNGYPTPGFRLGFPVVYGLHYNSQSGTDGYLMLMPSGSRVELRRIGSTNTYEAADSSYLHLVDNGDGTLLVRSTDGTQLSYDFTDNGFRCSQVKDRNGNYLSITNNAKGRIESVTDTLGRVFNFNYDTNDNLASISQTRGSGEYTWVTFGYTNLTLQTNFTGLTIIGLPNGSTLPVLSQVGLPDGTYYKFSYNTWGQVYKITNYAADSDPDYDNHALNYVTYNLPLTSSTAQTDCPRFTQRKDWAENWMSGAEVVTNYAEPALTDCDGITNGCKMGAVTLPDGTTHKEFTRSDGWQKGLPVLSETWANNDAQPPVSIKQRWSTTLWTQDNTGVSYMLNPRMTETNTYDPSGNRKRTSVSYSSFTLSCGTGCYLNYYLPFETKEYAANATDVLRTTQTEYNLSFDYTSRRIFGLPSRKIVCDAANCNSPVSKVEFFYDDTGEFLVQQGPPVQHDAQNYGPNHTWRGNLTRVRRWDVINTSANVESKTGYNTTGLPIFMRDPIDHQATISYSDSFADVGSANTFAYPTAATDPAGNQATTQYSYHVGVRTQTSGPPPAGQTQGAIVTHAYDSIGRLYQTTNAANGAYTQFIYPTSSNVIQSYTTIKDTQSPTVSAKLLDGAGRVRATAAEHPGSTGGYVGQYFVFNNMGRQIQQTNPTEIYGSWEPAGDDAAGWNWTVQTYDWKGRPRVSTNQDGSSSETTYGGCGCAGGEVVSVRDEVGRWQRVTSDVLGRTWKTQVLGWDGTTVYSTVTNTYNALDQVTHVLEQVGASGTGQETLVTYDGYGLLATKHVPVQASGMATSYSYNPDDTVSTMTDARGVVTTYSYNNRRLVTGLSYNTPAGITDTADVSFAYDAVGNRSQMTDGTGSVTYSYDRLSRLTSETRAITGVSGSFTLNYAYNVGGQLTSLTDPNDTNLNITYQYNQAGRLTEVSGNGYAGITEPYVTNTNYRAWGALKSYTFTRNTNTTTRANTYNSRMKITRFELSDNWGNFNGQEYQYNLDGRISRADDIVEPTFDRSFDYDFVGRLTQAKTGNEANGGSTPDGPFKQTMAYDAMNEMTSRTGRHWTHNLRAFAATYVNGRNTDPLWLYDAAGNITQDGNVDGIRTYTYDAAGRQIQSYDPPRLQQPAVIVYQSYDGNGSRVKNEQTGYPNPYLKYEIRSSALGGQVVAEIDSSGQKLRTNVYAWGEMIAYQTQNQVFRVHRSPIGSTVFEGAGVGAREVELDPLGNSVGVENPYQGGSSWGGGGYPSYGDGGDYMRCAVNGDPMPCKMIISRSHFEWISVIIRRHIIFEETVSTSVTNTPAEEAPTHLGGSGETISDESQVYINDGLTIVVVARKVLRIDLPTVAYIGIYPTTPQNSAPFDRELSLDLANVNIALQRESCRNLFPGDADPVGLLAILARGDTTFGSITRGDLGGPQGGLVDAAVTTGITGRRLFLPSRVGATLIVQSAWVGANITINNNAQAPGQVGYRDYLGVGANDAVYRAITLIHELGHAASIIYGADASRVLWDANNSARSRANSQLVYDNCFRPE